MTMKNIFKTSILALAVLIGLSGCADFFEKLPGPQLDLEDTFTNRDKTERFLNNIYSHIPDDATGDRYYANTSDRYGGIWGLGSMEAQLSFDWAVSGEYAHEVWNIGAASAADSQIVFWWGHFYKGIAKVGVFLQNVDMCTEIPEELRNMYKAEARALRAMYYFYIFRQYGPFVLLGETPMPIDADLSTLMLPRNTADECIDFIVAELDHAAEVFGTNMATYGVINGANSRFGRLDKGQCKALKAKVLLYAASPLFNGNTLMADVKNAEGTPLIPTTVDPAKWERARDAYKEFMDEFVPTYYDLHIVRIDDSANPNDGKVDYYESYRQATQSTYVDGNMKELIQGKLVWHGDLNYSITPKHTGAYNGDIKGGLGFSVTQQFVDMFFTDEGYRIEDPQSGYREYGIGVVPDASYYGSETDYNDPLVSKRNYFKANTDQTLKQWQNREPRFYVNVTYNGSTWLNTTTSDGEVTTNLTYSGNSGMNAQPQDSPITGYGWRKTARAGTEPRKDAHVSIQLRLADMYLGYAEALNETGNSALAMEYVNKVRDRAGVAQYGTGTYQDLNGVTKTRISYPNNKDDVRKRIQRERLVELALEASHFFDVRRWMLADMETGDGWVYPSWHNGGEGGDVIGLSPRQNAPDFFVKTRVTPRTFLKRMYFMPIPNAEILRNPLLVQNYEWSMTE
jgi:hypothetical protein